MKLALNSGDVIACGTNHEGLGPLQDGEVVDVEIRGMGADSTNPEAVRRNRPPSVR